MFNQALFHVLKYPAWISAEATPQSREAFMMQTTAGRDMTKKETYVITTGTMMIAKRIMIPTTIQIRIFISFHHISLRTRFAPRRKPWAETAKLSIHPSNQHSIHAKQHFNQHLG
jgi:hypothetical protein